MSFYQPNTPRLSPSFSRESGSNRLLDNTLKHGTHARTDFLTRFAENPTEIRFFLRLIDGLKVEKTELGQVK
jgi:hypothetical protein